MSRRQAARGAKFLWLIGPAAVGCGLAAHLLSGGEPPAAPVLLSLAALASMLAAILCRLQVPGWAVLLLSGLAQQVLPLAFSTLGSVEGGTAQRHGHQGVVLPDSLAAPVSGRQSMELMINLHAAAALVTMLLVSQLGKATQLNRAVALEPAKEHASQTERAPDDADA